MAWLALLLTLTSGWFLAGALMPARRVGWVAALERASLGALFGPGAASLLYFLLSLSGFASAAGVWILLAGLTACSFLLCRKMEVNAAPLAYARSPETRPAGSGVLLLWLALAVAAAGFAVRVSNDLRILPEGAWDAMAFWNLRAVYLTEGGDSWRMIMHRTYDGFPTEVNHPTYPLFVTGFVAAQWMAAGHTAQSVPIAASLLFAVATLALLGTSLARGRSAVLALLACLALLTSREFVSAAADQYSDVPLGLAMLAALLLLHQAGSSPPVLMGAGLAIGLAPWIKNEGWPFALAALMLAMWRFGKPAIWVLAGAAPGILITLLLKLLTPGYDGFVPRSLSVLIGRLLDPARWWQSLAGFAQKFAEAGPLWGHPLLLLVGLAVVLRLAPAAERRVLLWLAAPVAALLAADFGAYLITEFDLTWHIRTSAHRFVLQIWAPMLWLLFSLLRAPEEFFQKGSR